MNLLELISRLAGKYFAGLVIIVAAIAYLIPNSFYFFRTIHYNSIGYCYVWYGVNIKTS